MFYINNRRWQIFLVSNWHPALQRPDGSYSIGACDDETGSIYINEMLNEQLMWKVLCHEITHAAMFSYNILLTIEQEELLADLVATYGYEIIDITNKIFAKLKGEFIY